MILTNPDLIRSIEDQRDEWEKQRITYKEKEIEMEQKSLTLKQQTLLSLIHISWEKEKLLATLSSAIKLRDSRKEVRQLKEQVVALSAQDEDCLLYTSNNSHTCKNRINSGCLAVLCIHRFDIIFQESIFKVFTSIDFIFQIT